MKQLRPGHFRTVLGRWYGTPKEVWGFRPVRGHGTPRAIAWEFLRAHRDLLQVPIQSLHHRKTRHGVASSHVIFEQCLGNDDVRVHRAYVTVHIARDRVYLVKNRAVPPGTPVPSTRAVVSARRAVRLAHLDVPQARKMTKPEIVLFPREKELRLAWKIRLGRKKPFEEWIIYVDAKDGEILTRWDNLAALRRARIFDPNPAVALADWKNLRRARRQRRDLPESCYREVELRGLPNTGTLDGRRASTRRTPKPRVRLERLDLAAKARSHHFEEVMAYYHVDRSIRQLESMGYSGKRRLFKEALEIDAHGSRSWNAWYSPEQRRLVFGTESVDAAEDGEVILHELGHAIQDAIVKDFGQSPEAAAMGEGFGDYWAASAFADAKQGPERRKYQTCVFTWWSISNPAKDGYPPCERRLDVPDGFDSFDPEAGEHENAPIWSSTLWDVRGVLGRERADAAIVESHFQLDPFATFASAARAILDANRHLSGGRDEWKLVDIFDRRGIGPVV